MCKFFSALAFPTGDIKWHPALDSHTMIERVYGLRDDLHPGVGRKWAKVELVPAEDGGNLADPESWDFRLDEANEPDWWASVADRVRLACVAVIRGAIHADEQIDLIADGLHILTGNTIVLDCVGGRLIMSGSARVVSMYGSASVDSMSGSARVVSMYDSARVVSMYDSARVDNMSGSASVVSMSGSASVDSMSSSARVVSMYDSARVVSMSDSASVGSMYGSARAPRVPTGGKERGE